MIYSREELDAIAEALKALSAEGMTAAKLEKKSLKEMPGLKEAVAKRPVSLDIALFGRMVTSEYLADVDASLQWRTPFPPIPSTGRATISPPWMIFSTSGIKARGHGRRHRFQQLLLLFLRRAGSGRAAGKPGEAENRDALVRDILQALIRTMAFFNPSGKQKHVRRACVSLPHHAGMQGGQGSPEYVNAFAEPVETWKSQPHIVRDSVRSCSGSGLMDAAYALPIRDRVYFAPRFRTATCPRGGSLTA